MADWQKLTFNVPINESTSEADTLLIKGEAIHATTTRNGTIFLAEELTKSAKTLRNKPILKDHDNNIDSIVGRVTNKVSYDEASKAVLFEGKIKNQDVIDKINNGLIDSVSVGAMYKDIEYNEDNTYTLRGIEFLELSLVAVPADKNATFTVENRNFAQAVMESFDLKKKVTEEINLKKVEEKSKMDEEHKANAEMQELKAANEAMLKELATFRAEKAVKEAEELEQLQHEYKEVAEKLKLEARNVEGISKETLSILIEDLKKVTVEEEVEPEVEIEAEPESEDESEEDEVDEKMKGQVNKEVLEDESILDEFIFTTEEVSKGYGIYKENFDNPKLKR